MEKLTVIPRNWKPNPGTFSKGAKGSISLNFSESGSENCSDGCPHKGGRCYWYNVQGMRPSVEVSGMRKRLIGAYLCAMRYTEKLLAKVPGSVPWVRISTGGSVPNNPDAETMSAIKFMLVAAIRATGDPRRIHFPVETRLKARQYRDRIAPPDIVVRASCATQLTAAAATRAQEHNSYVELRQDGEHRRDTLARARENARSMDRAMVCPAIASTFEGTKPVKCGGDCIGCGDPAIMTIIYPEH